MTYLFENKIKSLFQNIVIKIAFFFLWLFGLLASYKVYKPIY